jgi:hypothetical protein
MSSLKAFLNPIKPENKEVIVSDRFQEDGKPVPFVIRPITQKENEQLLKKHTKRDKRGNDVFDRTGYIHELVASAVVFPDLKNAELQKAYGVLGEVELLKTMLYVGEFAELAQAVQELSGLDVDINEEIEEVKNG